MTFARFLAILFITNSHLDYLYPARWMASGGALGNCLFFFLSGYGLMRSELVAPRGVLEWAWRRAIRIYPAIWIFVLLYFGIYRSLYLYWSPLNIVSQFIWPTPFWFITALVAFYAAFYPLMKLRSAAALIGAMCAAGVAYSYYYLTVLDLGVFSIEGAGYFKWLFYFCIFIYGAWWGLRGSLPKGQWRHLAVFLACFAYYLMFRVGMSRVPWLGQWQFTLHAVSFPMTYSLVALAQSQWVERAVMSRPALAWFMGFIAAMTLEIYITQDAIYRSALVLSFPFPVNIAVFSVLSLVLSYALYRAAGFVRGALGKLETKWTKGTT